MYDNCVFCQTYAKLNLHNACESCAKEEQLLLDNIKDFLFCEGRQSINVLTEKFSISQERIYRWIRLRRLDFRLIVIECPICGKELQGLFCDCQKQTLVETASEDCKYPERFHTPKERRKKITHYREKIKRFSKQKRRFLLPAFAPGK